MTLVRVLAVGLALGAVACGGNKAPANAPVVAAAAPAASAGPARCTPPTHIAVAQVAEISEVLDGAASRLLIVETRSGRVVWEGPAGSGTVAPRWSPDGKRLAYAVNDDLIVHEDGVADRLAFRGLGDNSLFGLSGSGRWLAAYADERVVVLDLAVWSENPRASLTPVEAAVDCHAGAVTWAPRSEMLLIECGDETLRTWDPATGAKASVEVDEISQILGWWGGDTDSVIVVRDDGAVWGVSLAGQARELFPDGTTDSGIGPESVVPGAQLGVFSDYDADEGYPRTVWLARPNGPPIAWLDGVVTDLAFSRDGAWAVFATAVDTLDDSGDIYLARVGQSAVTRVLEAPRDPYDEGGASGDDGETEDAELADDDVDDAREGEATYLGFRRPVPRPQPGVPCVHAMPEERQQLELTTRLDDDELTMQVGGVVLDERGDTPALLVDGDRAVHLDETVGWTAATRLGNGAVLVVSDAGYTQWLSPDGQAVARLNGAVQDGVGLLGGGVALRVGADAFELRDKGGAVVGKVVSPDGIDEARSRGDGLAIQTGQMGVELIGPRGASLTAFSAPDAEAIVGLRGGGVAVIEPGGNGGDDDDDAAESFRVTVRDASGKVAGRHEVSGVASEMLVHTLALPDGGFAVVAGEELAKAYFFDRRAKLRGVYKLGLVSERPPAVFEDGTVVLVGPGERALLLVDSSGRYEGGALIDEVIVEGPHVVGVDRLVLETDGGLRIVDRRRRR